MTQTTVDLGAAARTFYTELDANDPGVYERRLTEDAVFAFNDADPVAGNTAIGQFVDAWKGNFQSVTHEIVKITADSQQGATGVEVIVKYVFEDGRSVDLKGCSFLDFAGEKISGYRVYVDTSKLA
jgi:ketosteroid isomerase-like protein